MSSGRLAVRVGHLVSPSTCWVSPLQCSDGLDAPEDAAIAGVVELEKVGQSRVGMTPPRSWGGRWWRGRGSR